MNSNIGIYVKALATLVVTGLTAYIAAAADGSVTAVEWVTIAIAVVVATGVVWAIPSTPKWFQSYGKAFAGALVAGLSSLAVGLSDGDPDGAVGSLSQAEIITAIVAFIVALGLVAAAPNAASSDPTGVDGRIVPVSYATKQGLVGGQPPTATPPAASTAT